jgi:hypothetical protein
MWCVGKEIINVTRIFILVLRNDVVQLFVGESTCRAVGYLFKIFKRSKEANNKRQRLESKLYIGFLLFIFSSSSSYLWIAFSISLTVYFVLFFWKKNSFYLSFSRPIFTVGLICWWPFFEFFLLPKLSLSFLLPAFRPVTLFKRCQIDEPIRISFSHGD